MFASSGLALSVASAKEVSFPQEKPIVSMAVPDDWPVSYTPFGLEIESPEKNVYIVADLQPRKKADAEAWAKKALVKMQAFGVTFEKPGVSPQTPPSPNKAIVLAPTSAAPISAPHAVPAKDATATSAPIADKAVASSTIPAAVPTEAPAKAEAAPNHETQAASSPPAALDHVTPFFTVLDAVTRPKPAAPTAPKDDPMPVFSGTPSLATPGRPEATLDVESDAPQGRTLEEMTKPVTDDLPSIPFKVGRYPDAMLNGQRIDVQVVNFGLSPRQLFVVIQASLSTDDRAVAIVKSVKRVP